MTPEEAKHDLESAHIKHVHFKSKLRSFLYGNGGSEGPDRDPARCSLGIWIADRMRRPGVYAGLPEAAEFDRKHVLIHQEANRLMDMSRAGQTEEAIAGFARVQAIADDMLALLRTIEAKARTGTLPRP
ncbi:MAG TPA: CZB domain-containing protein [Hymenobacter sp.]|jgi:hypothetical protein|uniref:CZB domain-containing protein n=1 Tax=Hymenobacter sp. TaxID=1898978 RepID=UPI002ED8F04D